MSVTVMSLVFDAGNLTPTQKSILLALADHANEDGRSIYPSVHRLEIKTGFGERAIRKGLAEMRDTGLLIVVKEATQHYPTEYAINIDLLKELRHPDLNLMHRRPAPDAPQQRPGVHDIPSRPAPDAPESSYNHHVNQPSGEREAAKPPTPSLLIGDTPGGRIIQAELERALEGTNRTVPKKYNNLQQKDAYLLVFQKLNGDLTELVRKGISRGITSRPKLLGWLEGCAKNKNGNNGAQADEPAGFAAIRAVFGGEPHGSR